MALLKVKDLSGFDIYQKYNAKTNITEFYSWMTNYLDKDFTKIKFNKNEEYDEISFLVNYRNESDIKFKILMKEKLFFESECSELNNIALHVKCKTNNLYDFLVMFSSNINSLNTIFSENEIKEENQSDNEEPEYESDYIYEDSENEYDPFNEFKSNKSEGTNIFEEISKFRRKAIQGYEENPINKTKLDISQDFIINVIIREIESIYNNCKGIKMIPINDDIFNIDIEFNNFESENLMKNMADCEIDSIIMNIKLDEIYTPIIHHKYHLRQG